MAEMLSAGIYDREVDLSTVIAGLSTTTGAIVGEANRGPVDVPTLITSRTDFLNIFGEPTVGKYAMYTALQFMEEANRLYFVRVVSDDAKFDGVKVLLDGTDNNEAFVTGPTSLPAAAPSGNELFFVFMKGQGEWGQNYGLSIINYDDYNNLPDSEKTVFGDLVPNDSDEFIVGVYDKNELTYNGMLYLVSRNPNKKDLWNRSMYIEDVINNDSLAIIEVQDGPYNYSGTWPESTLADSTTVSYVTFGGGADGTAAGNSEVMAGWEHFENMETYAVNILMSAGYTSVAVLNKIIDVTEMRTDAIAILDPDYSMNSVSSVVNWRKTTWNPNSSYICTYYPWIYVHDRYTDKQFYLPPSGMVGAVFCYNDRVAEPWFAPAGFNRGIIRPLSLRHNATQGERDILYLNGINPIVSFPGEGIVVWGQKTLQSRPSAFDRVNVRRLMCVLRTSINKAMRYSLFEPNDYFTRKYITSILESYLEDIVSRRGLYEFEVICDTTNNTGEVIDRNELVIDIGLQPVKTAEFIKISYI
ncbi:MAG: phage tail sheath C-terminal domain-containing protein, partial [Candidatus Neomarinimicrobiota bacterium]